MTAAITQSRRPRNRRHANRRPGPRLVAARVALAALALADAAAIIGLHALRGQSWAHVDWAARATWLERDPADVVLACLRLVALVLVYWLAAAIIAGGIGALRRRRSPASWYEIPLIRRLVERALAVGVTVTTTAAALTVPAFSQSAAAQDGPLPPIPVVVEQPEPSQPPVSSTPPPPAIPINPAPPAPGSESMSPEVRRAPPAPLPHRSVDYVVQPGDSLWSIAAAQLAAARAVEPCDSAVAAYWSALIEANRAHLRSGDPDLIYPGEHVLLVTP